MSEDFRELSLMSQVATDFLTQLASVTGNLHSFMNQTSQYWRGNSFDHLISECSNCISDCDELRRLVSGFKNIMILINKHNEDHNMIDQLEEENRSLRPHLYWYDSDGDRHINRSVQRTIKLNNNKIRFLIKNLNSYVDQIKSITGGE